jgi:hypothetical protein
MAIADHTEYQVVRNATKRNPAGDRKHRQPDPPVYSATEDESRHCGDRQGGKRFFPDVLTQLTALRRANG